jgi:hypothetical protein
VRTGRPKSEDRPLLLHLFARDITPEESFLLLRWCHRRGADEFTLRCAISGASDDVPPGATIRDLVLRRREGKRRGCGPISRPEFPTPFQMALDRHHLGSETRTVLTDGNPWGAHSHPVPGEHGGDFRRSVPLYRLNEASIQMLMKRLPEGLFFPLRVPARGKEFLENPTFYRGGELMLGIVTHEEEGVLLIRSEERPHFDLLNLPSRTQGMGLGVP